MSYSFSVKAASKAEAKAEVSRKLQEVVVSQPFHAADADIAEAAFYGMVDKLGDDVIKDVVGSCNGSCSVFEGQLVSCGFSGSFSLQART